MEKGGNILGYDTYNTKNSQIEDTTKKITSDASFLQQYSHKSVPLGVSICLPVLFIHNQEFRKSMRLTLKIPKETYANDLCEHTCM